MSSTAPTNSNSTAAQPQQTRRVLIVDDHPLFRDGLRELLQKEQGLVIVGEAESEADAFQAFTDLNPDVVTVDVSLATGSGLKLVSRIKERKPSTIVLVLSMFQDSIYARLALAAGASGYICKHTNNAQLINAVNDVLSGRTYVSPEMRHDAKSESTFDAAAFALKENRLSSRELQIFTLIGEGRSTPEIAAELSLAVSTVETYRERLKSKLNLVSGSALTRHAIVWMMQNS